MAKSKTPDTRPDVIYCACGCGGIVPKARYPSNQARYINTHQHRGVHNGNYRGGKETRCCPICQATYQTWPGQDQRTCGKDDCYRKWQGITSAARGRRMIEVTCAHCGKTLYKYPSQVKERNFCNHICLTAYFPKQTKNNGNWRGGKWKFVRDQVLHRDNYRCVICGFEYRPNVHHITPVSDGGTNDFCNLVTLCPNHHAMADEGVINVEYLRSYDWTPATAMIAGASESTDQRRPRRKGRKPSRIARESAKLYPDSSTLHDALGIEP